MASVMCSERLGQEPGPQWSPLKSLEKAPVLRWSHHPCGLPAISLCRELSRTTCVIPPECRVDEEEVGTQLNVPHSDGGTVRSCPHLPGKENLL
ncbi:uncharacterized protein ACIBXB_014025 isoform 1-T1 [Morphnus guianensis]